MKMRRPSLAALAGLLPATVAVLASCGGDLFVRAPPDAEAEGGIDAGPDAIGDAPIEAAPDASPPLRVQWVKAFGSAQAQVISGLAALPSGDAVIAGTMAGSVSFGGPTLTSAGKTDIFVAQLAGASGAHVMSARYGDPAAQLGLGVAVTQAGDIFFGGIFQGTVTFSATRTLVANLDGSFDAFVARLKPGGAYDSDSPYQGTLLQSPFGIALDKGGALVVAGENDGTMTTPAQTVQTKGGADVFVSKATASPFAAGYGDAQQQRARAVAVDADGNILVAGELQGALDFGSGTPLLVAAGGYDAFVAKLDPQGKALWAKAYGNAADQSATAVGVDPKGNVYLAGTFAGQIALGGTALSSAGLSDVFVAKLDANGTHQWSKGFGGSGIESATGLDVDANGDVIVTGELGSTADFGGGTLTSAGLSDIFVAAFDTGGAPLGSARFGDADAQTGGRVAFAPNGFLLAGTFRGSISLDGNQVFSSAGDEDVLVARFIR